ncbi:MAG: exonuclease domain-containing protein, partial [Bacteroidia bacterium]|nr:exonuclease domain-containing protein [Bacteroidia bacterium]
MVEFFLWKNFFALGWGEKADVESNFTLVPMTRFAIVDLETTGSSPTEDRITEVAILLHDGEKVLESFTTLVNPERDIPHFITRLTGINNR